MIQGPPRFVKPIVGGPSGPSLPRVPEPFVVDRQGWGSYTLASLATTGLIAGVGSGDLYEAIEIADDSEAADCFVFPKGTPVPAAVATTSLAWARQAMAQAVHISVGSPYVGPIQGPFQIAPRYFDWSTSGGLGTIRGGISQDKYLHRLKLRVWPHCPPFLMKRRPDATYLNAVTMLGTVAETDFLNIPAYGREDLLITLNPTISMSGGTFTIRVYGEQPGGSGSSILLDTIAFTAVADDSREYEGKFDHYRVTYQAAAVTSVGSPTMAIDAVVRDKR